MRVNLDGTNVVTIRRGLDNPNGIALTSGEIFMLDSHYRKQNGGDKKDGSLYIVSKKDGSIKEIKNTKLKVIHSHDFYNFFCVCTYINR